MPDSVAADRPADVLDSSVEADEFSELDIPDPVALEARAWYELETSRLTAIAPLLAEIRAVCGRSLVDEEDWKTVPSRAAIRSCRRMAGALAFEVVRICRAGRLDDAKGEDAP